VDPSHYVYAYQIDAVRDGVFGVGTGYVSRFSVGITGIDGQPTNIGDVAGTSVVAPSNAAFAPPSGVINTAGWDFNTGVYAGQSSTVLYFTSPFEPEWDNASVSGAYSFGDTQQMPSPTPEPVTLTMLVGGALMLVARRRRNRE